MSAPPNDADMKEALESLDILVAIAESHYALRDKHKKIVKGYIKKANATVSFLMSLMPSEEEES